MHGLRMNKFCPITQRDNLMCLLYKLVFQNKINGDNEGCSSELPLDKFWTRLWGLCTAPKVSISFLWRVYNDILLTRRKNLSKSIPTIQACCLICSEVIEDALNIFLGSPVMLEVWFVSNFTLLVGMFLESVTLPSILERVLDWPIQGSSRFTYILWCIWIWCI